METQNKSDFYLHSLMCLIGGFLGAYAILNFCGNLASAQTSNLLYIVLCLLGRDIKGFLLRLFGLFLYFLAIEIYVFLTHKTQVNVKRYSITVTMIGLILIVITPDNVDPIVKLLPIFFMMSTQWSVFHGANGYNSSTIFSTNNLRQTALAIGEYFCCKDNKHMDKAKFFANSLLWYHIGAVIAFFACKLLGIYGCLICFIPALISLMITYNDSKLESDSLPQSSL